MTSTPKHITLIGAGLVGSLLAIYLRRHGYAVTVYERRPDVRKTNQYAGRSINLALSDRGIRALEEIGAMEEIRAISIPMHGRQLHHADGSSGYQAYGQSGQYINSVSRGQLNRTLMDLAEKEGAEIRFSHRCDAIDWEQMIVRFTNTETQESVSVKSELIFGSDGAFAASRLTYHVQHDRFQYQQQYIDFGYKELTIPASPGGAFRMNRDALHIWPRGNYMLIALPNPDGSFTCTLFFPFEGEPSFASLDTPENVRRFFRDTFTDAAEMMPDLETEYFQNPTSSLVTVSCFPWIKDQRFALIGDAAHAIVPFFGQGMNCGFEDCSVLNQLIGQYGHDWSQILPAYQQLRKPDADAIATLALNNFIEMRDKVADPRFLLQKKIESRFSEKYPSLWTPAYSLVTFRPDVRYSEALERGLRQQAVMDRIMDRPDIQTAWDSEWVEQQMLDAARELATATT